MKRNQKPMIRVLHHMARSGGTILSRCLGCMEGIVLLSEIHPLGYEKQLINPLAQAHQWFNLLTPADVAQIRARQAFPFVDAIKLIHRRCSERGLALVIRDWSHLDFTGWPHLDRPVYKLSTIKVLAPRFRVVHTASVRHPIDQWLSFRESQSWTGKELSLERYLLGYRKFAEQAVRIGFSRYEDFVDQPDKVLEHLCARLRIPYDSAFREKWNAYRWITTATRDRDGGFSISRRSRRTVDQQLLQAFSANRDYRAAIALLGYGDPY